MRGYFGIGIYNSKTPHNLGTLWRSAQNFGASFIFVVGKRYKKQATDTLKTYRSVPLFQYDTIEEFKIPYDCRLIGVEQTESSKDIMTFKHPERAVYILGSEDNGLPLQVQERCQSTIHIDTPRCLNVAVAGSIVMFNRVTPN